MTLYELTGDYQKFSDIMEQVDIPEDLKTELEDALKNLAEDIEDKLENYGKIIKNFESDIAGLKAEEERLSLKRKTLENRIVNMKLAMKEAMVATNKTKVKTSLFSFSVQKNVASVKFDIPDEQIPKLLSKKYLIPVEPKVDKKLLKEDLESGDPDLKLALSGIAHLEQSESIRIR